MKSNGAVLKTGQKEGAKKLSVGAGKRANLSQLDVPSVALEDAMRIPRAIADQYASRPTAPLDVASALQMHPNSGSFRMLCGAAAVYGLTEGGAWAPQISITSLGKRVLHPTIEGDDLAARREALLKPRILAQFLRNYAGAPFPREDIATNVLAEMGVPREKAKAVFELIASAAESVGLLRDIKGRKYVDRSADRTEPRPGQAVDNGALAAGLQEEAHENSGVRGDGTEPPKTQASPGSDQTVRRVFIAHGTNRDFVDPIKKLLAFGEMQAVVSVEHQSISQPVPEKVMSEMRGCAAAIIHVDAETPRTDQDGKEVASLNLNVLIEIGAAMALYGRRFILLVKEGLQLPSNLQGLYQVRYSGSSLDGDATIRLLQAIQELKTQPVPSVRPA